MPPATRGTRGHVIPKDNLVGRGRDRGRGRGHGRVYQNDVGNDQFDQNAGVGNNQDNQADQDMALQRILECLDNIEASNQIPGGGANDRRPLVQGINLPIEDDPVARAQLKDLSKIKGSLFYGT